MIRDNYLDVSTLIKSPEVLELFRIVTDNGGVLRFVGGAVRDALKGIKGSDLNLVTDLSPEELVEACSEEGINTIPLGIKQGTIGVIIGDTQLEVSSLSKQVEKDGVSQIEFTDNWEADASRRDLTINAVYADEKGNVFDYYNGIEDLEKGYVRFIGSAQQRIREDYVRILRYFRFYSLFGLEEPNTKAIEACFENRSGLKKIPMERIRDELFKIICTENAPRTFRLMQKNNILEYILPDAQYVDDLEFFIKETRGYDFDDEALIKLFILYRPNEALAENLAIRLKFSRREKQLFVGLAEEKLNIDDLINHTFLLKKIYEYDKDFVRAKILTTAAETRNLSDKLWNIYYEIRNIPDIVFPLKGKDVLDKGVNNSQQVGIILKELEKIWIDSGFSMSKEELLLNMDNLKDVI